MYLITIPMNDIWKLDTNGVSQNLSRKGFAQLYDLFLMFLKDIYKCNMLFDFVTPHLPPQRSEINQKSKKQVLSKLQIPIFSCYNSCYLRIFLYFFSSYENKLILR